MKNILFIIVTLITFSLSANTEQIKLTNQEQNIFYYSVCDNNIEAPQGYSWVKLKAIKTSVLQPDNWFFNAEKQNKTLAYFITKEDYTKDPNQMFATGFSLNVLTDIGERKAVNFVETMVSNLIKQGTAIKQEEIKNNNLIGKLLIIQIGNTIIEYKIVGNKQTNKVYIASFETPANKWEKNKNIAKTILDKLNFNQKF